MYLKKIIASGFKSFADKTTIDLVEGISGVVGPNGSGKSNVVDAVRWVLGEQSVKSLRGDGAMTDVIFSGSKSRKAMNVASVALVFDNSDHYLNLEYDEVSIKRRVYKDGTNEYFINNEKCRLKDITDTLLDSGIGKESFNIISQGKVEEIINSKPENRRTIFEEAAGVLKYKKRKEEALRKLERTHNNMNRVEDILTELESQVAPLKEQSEKAIQYQNKMKELEDLDISLITNDITSINFDYQDKKEQIEILNKEIMGLDTSSTSSDAKVEDYKININKLDNQINDLQRNLIEKTAEVEKLNSRKDLLIERQKYEVENSKLHDNLINLKEEELKQKSEVNTIKEEINEISKQIEKLDNQIQEIETDILKVKVEKQEQETLLTNSIRNKNSLNNRINYLKETIENNNSLPSSVRNILNNPKLRGICDVIGNILEIEEQYATALTTSLGYATNYVVVDDENKAKEAIRYLNDNKIGRVTFFPLNIIKSKYIDSETIKILKTLNGYIDTAANLVKYDIKYKNIIENQLGNVIVAKDIDSANIISKKINHRYKIVTLNGELLHVGGSVTGGKDNRNHNVIQDKYELEDSLKKLQKLELNITKIENEINEIDYKYKSIEDKLYLVNKDRITLSEKLILKNNYLKTIQEKLEKNENEISNTNSILNDSISKEEEKILKKYYDTIEEKNKIVKELEKTKNKRSDLNMELGEFEASIRKENSILYSKTKELKALEIEVNRMDVKLDNLLTRLNDTYNLTYEKAITLYKLEIDEELARNKVGSLKRAIKDLGNVNIGAIEEYQRVNERYEFLNNQKEDLRKAEDTLLEIINEMDDVMSSEFINSFNSIKENFKVTFKELFKGGNAELKLTDPNNLLETGIEIIASPPGKKMKKLSLLSGGEKTFTAISLLFAILKSRPVPFCILDEVEAALDEVNVTSFGEYVLKLKEKTQFILITHKKKTMEYADVLYGITMQESGVSKLVSVKLEGIK